MSATNGTAMKHLLGLATALRLANAKRWDLRRMISSLTTGTGCALVVFWLGSNLITRRGT
jgi:hypothetical protein